MREPPLPHGVVTLLLTDVEASTRKWEESPDAMKHAISRLGEVLDETVAHWDGHLPIEQGAGDSVVAAFGRATDAVACSLDIQRRLAAEPWPTGCELAVRVALHTGETEVHAGQYRGTVLNRCARIREIAHGGQTIVSEATAGLVRDQLPTGATLRDLGVHRLRDLARPERLWQLCHPDLRDHFAPLLSLDTVANNLPVQLTTFIGREREMAEVRELLAVTRLLTLTGAGGAGKTRLALQIAADLLADYPDGVWLVELAQLTDPALVPQAAASVLGLSEESGRELSETVVEAIRSKRLMLILDNCEHLIHACAAFAETLLVTCPKVVVLATSREPLGVLGETIWSVPSLSLPDPASRPSPDQLEEYEATRLFSERARLADPSFFIDDKNAAGVLSISHRLDGIPLAIELAAPRVKVLSIAQIAERLGDRFRLLTGGARTALPRQQTLRALIDWSYDLLDENERTLFKWLSVFAGGFSLESVEGVSASSGLERGDVFYILSRLVDKSLILAEDTGAEVRYRLLESVREYGREKLAESTEAELVFDAHLEWFRGLAERVEPELQGMRARSALDFLEASHADIRRALEWGSGRGLEDASRLLAGVWRFWFARGYWTEGRRWLESALDQTAVPSDVRLKLLIGAAALTAVAGDYEAAARSFEAGLSATDLEGIDALLAVLNGLGNAAYLHALTFMTDPSGEERYRAAVDLAKSSRNERGEAAAMQNLAVLAVVRGDSALARLLVEESLSILQAIGDRGAVGIAFHFLGQAAQGLGDYTAARAAFESALAVSRELGVQWGVSAALRDLGLVAQAKKDYAVARALQEEALALARESGSNRSIGISLSNLGWIALEEGDEEEARSMFEESLEIARSLGDRWGESGLLRALGQLAAKRRDFESARALLGRSLEMAREWASTAELGASLLALGTLFRDEGDLDRARPLLEETLSIARRFGAQHHLGKALIALGELERLAGETASARERFEEALSVYDMVGDREAAAASARALGAIEG